MSPNEATWDYLETEKRRNPANLTELCNVLQDIWYNIPGIVRGIRENIVTRWTKVPNFFCGYLWTYLIKKSHAPKNLTIFSCDYGSKSKMAANFF